MNSDQRRSDAPPDRGLGRPIIQAADPIDRVVRLTPKWTVFALIACGLLVVGVGIWSVLGTVTSSVTASGLYIQQGAANVVATKGATVHKVLVTPGQKVVKGQALVSLEGGAVLSSPQDGTITSVLVSDGSAMWPGKTAVVVTDLAAPDDVVALVPADLTGTVGVGLPVRIDVSLAPASKYGYLLGTVDEISYAPYTTQQIAEKIGIDQQIVAGELGTKPALLATIKLNFDAGTPSSYRWSVGQGPPFGITQGVPVKAQIILDQQHPLDLVFPGVDRNGS